MSIKILLADDSITIQKVVGIIFGGEEYSLTVVDNGKAAVEKAREINPDVLLIDALMPGMSGYEVCETVRATPGISSKPILLLTGSFEPFDEDKAKSCGANDFLAKPFESQQIVNKVKELFELASTGSEAPAVAPEAEPEAFIPPLVPEAAEEETVAENDIWGAFTTPDEPAPVAVEAPQTEDLDVFAVVSEEPESAVAEPQVEASGSQWIPVEEETFAFEEAAPQESTFAESTPELSVEESMFGDTDFGVAVSPQVEEGFEIEEAPAAEQEMTAETAVETVAEEPAEATFEIADEPAVEEPVAPQPVESAVIPVAAPLALTEDQLREALAAASKDVIERIVWEVVPDLAEVLIKEAIRKIKEGQ